MKWSLLLFGFVAIAGTASACEGLSPGDLLDMGDHICTLGFLVANADGIYFTTAGHCIQVDERASTPDVGEWGTGVFHFLDPETGSQTDGSPGMDFALIKVDPSAYGSLNPKMCGWEGPTGIYNESVADGFVGLYGHSLLFGDAGSLGLPTYRREGVLTSIDSDTFYFVGPSLMGDSGSAVLHQDGRALGVLTHLTAGTAGTNGGTHLERGFRLAADAGFKPLRLVLMGEDPVAVLREIQGAPPTPPTDPLDDKAPPTNTTAPTKSNPTPSKEQPPANQTAEPFANDIIDPASSDQGPADPAKQNTPGPALGVTLALALAVALALPCALRKR